MVVRRVPAALLVTLTSACAVLALSQSAFAQQTVAADRFVESVGVNVHLHYDNTAYRNQFPLIKSRLLDLGVRHVRDGLIDTEWRPYYDRHNELGQAGIKGTFITSPEQSTSVWTGYPARMARSFEAYEAPNEYDMLSKRPDWASVLRETMTRLGTLQDDPGVGHFPIIGPSLTSPASYAALGDVSAHFDYANLHNYFAGRHPGTPGWGTGGYGSIPWNLALAAQYSPGKPVMTTETGYQDDASIPNSVPRDVAGRYMPILLLEQFRAGIVRTFLYELCDFPRSGGYGLLTEEAAPKPAFTAVKSLLTLLADPGTPFTPANLAYSVSGGTGDTRHLTFQKRDGSYFVAIWQARSSYDPETRTRLHVAAEQVVLTVPSALRAARTHQWQLDGSRSTGDWSALSTTMPLTIADRLVVVEMITTAPPPAAPKNLRRVPQGSG